MSEGHLGGIWGWGGQGYQRQAGTQQFIDVCIRILKVPLEC
jgi:hypothetical protein